jgi:hypothetical protein
MGVPTGWVALLLAYVPVWQISKVAFNFDSRKNKIIHTAIAMLMMVLVYFYSALSLVVLWILACMLTGNRFLLIGASFHPAGFILGFFYSVIFPGRLRNFIYLLSAIILMAILSFFRSIDLISFVFIDNQNIKFNIQLDMIWELLVYVFDNKPTEAAALLSLLFLGWLNWRSFGKSVIGAIHCQRRNSESSYGLLLAIPFVLLMANSLIREKDSLFLSIIKMEYSDNIYITWLDFGSRDFVGTFDGVNNDRI